MKVMSLQALKARGSTAHRCASRDRATRGTPGTSLGLSLSLLPGPRYAYRCLFIRCSLQCPVPIGFFGIFVACARLTVLKKTNLMLDMGSDGEHHFAQVESCKLVAVLNEDGQDLPGLIEGQSSSFTDPCNASIDQLLLTWHDAHSAKYSKSALDSSN